MITRLPVLVLHPHSRCNCRCVMCDIWKTDAGEMSARDLDRRVDDIAALGVEWVVLSGGEPLMHSDLFRFCERLRKIGVRTTLLSTGLLLGRRADQVTAHVHDVIVSLDGPPEVHDRIRRVAGAFDQLADGVRALHAVKHDFPVSARCTVQKTNFGCLRDTVQAARDLGLRSISFLAADVTSTAFNRREGWPPDRQSEVALTAEETDALENELDELIRCRAGDIESGFIAEPPAKLRKIARHFRAHMGLVQPVSPRCNAPWISAVIEADGTVRPCFFHEPIGGVQDRSLHEVLNSPEAIRFREELDIATNPVCRRCVCSLYQPMHPGSGGAGVAGHHPFPGQSLK